LLRRDTSSGKAVKSSGGSDLEEDAARALYPEVEARNSQATLRTVQSVFALANCQRVEDRITMEERISDRAEIFSAFPSHGQRFIERLVDTVRVPLMRLGPSKVDRSANRKVDGATKGI